jgi:hypothetical protein
MTSAQVRAELGGGRFTVVVPFGAVASGPAQQPARRCESRRPCSARRGWRPAWRRSRPARARATATGSIVAATARSTPRSTASRSRAPAATSGFAGDRWGEAAPARGDLGLRPWRRGAVQSVASSKHERVRMPKPTAIMVAMTNYRDTSSCSRQVLIASAASALPATRARTGLRAGSAPRGRSQSSSPTRSGRLTEPLPVLASPSRWPS